MEKDKISGDLEEHIEKQLCEEKGINEEDIENESDEFIDAIGILDLEWIDVSDSIDEETFDNTINICNLTDFGSDLMSDLESSNIMFALSIIHILNF